MLQVEHQFSHFRAPSIKAPILWFSKLHSGSFFLLKFGCTRLPSVNVEIKRSLCSALTAAAQSSFKDGFFSPRFCRAQRSSSDLIYFDNKRRTFGTTFNEAVSHFAIVVAAGSGIEYVRNVTFCAQSTNTGGERESQSKNRRTTFISPKIPHICA